MAWKKGECGNPEGRKLGSKNKRTLAREAVVGEGLGIGKLPVEFLLSVMRNSGLSLERRVKAASAVAPYIHPRLEAIQHSGTIGRPEHDAAVMIAALPGPLQDALLEHFRADRPNGSG